MPLYEYECKKCRRRVEKIRKFSDPPLTTCEHCGGELDQLISSPAIQFKGSGWYVTDYAKKSSADSGPSSPAASTSSTTSSEKTEKKAAETSKPEPAKTT